MVYRPSASVLAPRPVPTSVTCALGSPLLLSASLIVPTTRPLCASSAPGTSSSNAARNVFNVVDIWGDLVSVLLPNCRELFLLLSAHLRQRFALDDRVAIL